MYTLRFLVLCLVCPPKWWRRLYAISAGIISMKHTPKKQTLLGNIASVEGTLHSARGAMVDLSHESGPKSEAVRGRHCCSDAENGDSPRMFASIMQMIVRPILMIT